MFSHKTGSTVVHTMLLLLGLAFVVPGQAIADSFWTRFMSSSITVDEDGPHPAPPAAIDWCGNYYGLGGECTTMGCSNSGVTRWKAHADKTWVDLWQNADANVGDTGSCHQGGDLLARSTFDVTFECEAGVPTPISASLNFEVDGYASFASPGPANYAVLTVQAGPPGSSGEAGTWVAASSQYSGPTDGVFTGINSDSLSGFFTGPSFSPTLNVPVSIQLGGLLVLNSHMPNHDPVTGDFWDGAAQGGQGINLPVGSLVFDLPEGCTCNAENVNIIDNRIVERGVIRTEPSNGGNNGVATVVIVGAGFEEGASVSLQGSGHIVGINPSVYRRGTRLQAMFDLRGAIEGDWDVVVQNPDGSTATKSAAFTVQAPRPNQIRVSLSSGRFRPGVPSSYFVRLTNLGNTDAVGVPLTLWGPPADTQIEFDPPLLDPEPTSEVPDWSAVPVGVANNDTLYVPLIINYIPAGQTITLAMTLTFQQTGRILLRAEAGPVLFESIDLLPEKLGALSKGAIGDCADGAFSAALGCIPGVGPGVPCWLSFASSFRGCISDIWGFRNLDVSDGLVVVVASVTRTWFNCVLAAASAGGCAGITGASLPFALPSCILSIAGFASGSGLACCVALGLPVLECDGPDADEIYLDIQNSFDPNEKVAGRAISSQGYIPEQTSISFEVFFENLVSATAPAATIEIIDELDANVDAESLQLGPVRLGSRVLMMDPYESAEPDTFDLRPDNDVLVSVEAQVVNRIATWRFIALDPVTLLPITDPDRGLLPPNANPPEGEGSVSFTVVPEPGLGTGTEISNTASIIFDANPPIVTNTVRRIIDADPPQTAVQPLQPVIEDTTVVLTLAGSDAHSGLMSYFVYASEDGEPYQLITSEVIGDSVVFTGRMEHSYTFYSVGRDTAGNYEMVPENPDAETTLSTGASPVISTLPTVFALGQNSPNPFNPQTTIAFDLPKQTAVSLHVFDVAGRLVRTLVDDEIMAGGRQEATWKGRDDGGRRVAAGVYFYRLDAGEYSETKRMALLK